MGNVTLACGIAFGVQIDGNAFGGVVLCVQITAAAGGGFLLGAAGGVGLLYKGCSLFGRSLGGCIEHRGGCQCRHRQQGQQHTAGQQDAYNAFGFHKVSLLSCGFYTGCRYYKYTTNWAKTKEILREWGLKLREWLKKEGKLKHCCPGMFSFDTKREPEKCQRFRRAGATKKGLLAPFNPKEEGYTGKN